MVDVERFELVVDVVDLGELVRLRREGIARTNDVRLEADWVDLWCTNSVKADQAVSDEIVATVSRDHQDRHTPVECWQEW